MKRAQISMKLISQEILKSQLQLSCRIFPRFLTQKIRKIKELSKVMSRTAITEPKSVFPDCDFRLRADFDIENELQF